MKKIDELLRLLANFIASREIASTLGQIWSDSGSARYCRRRLLIMMRQTAALGKSLNSHPGVFFASFILENFGKFIFNKSKLGWELHYNYDHRMVKIVMWNIRL